MKMFYDFITINVKNLNKKIIIYSSKHDLILKVDFNIHLS